MERGGEDPKNWGWNELAGDTQIYYVRQKSVLTPKADVEVEGEEGKEGDKKSGKKGQKKKG